MRYTDFTMKEHGFVGHMAEPEEATKQAVLVISGGEKSILPGIKIAERQADIHIEELDARILLIAGTGDEAVIYPNASHILGIMPSRESNKVIYRMLPLIGMIYRSINTYRKDCMKALEDSERKIIEWIKNDF